ncbi:MAG TPA: exosortase/archaeosortase family protein [Bryobacteraceae bacterium]|jgi:exosortase|nr:exosortase/archaeosortase family protein [Bryobacteraceae bacterium]
MSIAQANAVPETDPAALPFKRFPWLAVAFFTALLLICYAGVLHRLVLHWMEDPDMGHGFFVPFVAVYVAWTRRDRLARAEWKPCPWGIVLLLWGAAQMLAGSLGAELFLARTAFLISLVGLILTLAGRAVVRVLAFPLFLLLFMIPIPRIVYSQITMPLQFFASQVAETLLSVIGIPVLRDGNILQLPSETLSVVEACSGIRSLLSLSFLSLIYAFLFDRKVWMRWALLFSTVPIAIAANAGRITLTGILGEYKPALAHGVFHSLEGGVLFVAALAILAAVHRFLNWFYNGYTGARARKAAAGAGDAR